MARRRRRSGYTKSYSRPRRSYSTRSRSRRASGGQTLRIMLQQPSMQQARPRAPFGSFQPTAMFNPFMAPYIGMGAPWPQQGGPGVPGARMVINPVNDPQAPGEPDGGGNVPPVPAGRVG